MVSIVVRDEIIWMGALPDPPIDVFGPSILRDTFHAVSNFINGRCLIPIALTETLQGRRVDCGRVVGEKTVEGLNVLAPNRCNQTGVTLLGC